jgi:hypothetical protein
MDRKAATSGAAVKKSEPELKPLPFVKIEKPPTATTAKAGSASASASTAAAPTLTSTDTDEDAMWCVTVEDKDSSDDDY